MQLHQLQPTTKRKAAKRIGRGGKRGKTSGRGHKGQNARAGNSGRPEMREFIKKIPKLRGHGINRAKTVNADTLPIAVVNIALLESVFETGATVSPKTLAAKGASRTRAGRPLAVKVLGNGELTKKLTISGCTVSKSAREKIEKAGGTIA